jgi:hypothetical protein
MIVAMKNTHSETTVVYTVFRNGFLIVNSAYGCQKRVLTHKLVRVYVLRYEKRVNSHVNSFFCKLVEKRA